MAVQTHHHTQQSSQQEWDTAIQGIINQIQQQQQITTVDEAIETLNATGDRYASASVHAMYLQKVPESPGFTRKDVSIYLADLGDEHELLTTYFHLVHFGGLSIEDSLRMFYTQLRLVPLLNKNMLNTLLLGLATAFKTNGGNFGGDVDDCIRVYNVLIMLNDSLHSKNALGRARQTEQAFMEIINDRKEANVFQFEEDEMRRIYHNIQMRSLDGGAHAYAQSGSLSQTQPQANGVTSYSKYGAPSPNATANEQKNLKEENDDDTPAPDNTGACCVIL
eukprot:CAMPEP_0202719782 /NCGR_PEP_ID=MMETSP1385-20130828/134376_1 /ASSEMBLY_ACC=CAM_ASM_000861 /TAXON_ID=933848 /ORGANISM="Elphidium margaritaceum" /LENGTH=277 /DNA_ID=CAMNT_0049383139 /DNA_START=57 /DNA_END=890 /DNA_ORIENTATION=-